MATKTDPTTLTIAEADQLVDDVAQLLPFSTTLDADMGDTWANQIYFGGQIDESTGRPIHRAGIDPDEENPVWWLDFDLGARQIISDLVATTSPTDLVAWIIVNATATSHEPAAEPAPGANTAPRPRSSRWHDLSPGGGQ